MISPALLLVATLAAPLQDAARAPAPDESTDYTPVPLSIPGVVQRPAELVAARVSSVLRSNSDDAWLELADALPELALMGGADLTSTFEAAQLAEQAGSAAGLATPGWEWADVRGLRDWAASITPTRLIIFVLGVLTLSLLTLTLLRRRGAKPTPARQRVKPTGAERNPLTARFVEARQLASAGLAVPEIARRTGMAREAVTLLVGPCGS